MRNIIIASVLMVGSIVHAYTNTQVVIMDNIVATDDEITDLYNYVDNAENNITAAYTAEDLSIRNDFAVEDADIRTYIDGLIATTTNSMNTADLELDFELNNTRNTLSNRIDNLEIDYAGEDTDIRSEFATEDTNIRNEFAIEDTNIRNEFATEDTDIRNNLSNEVANIRAEFAVEDANIRGEFAAEDTNIRNDFELADAAILDIVSNYFPAPISNYVAALNNDNNIERNILRNNHTNRMIEITNEFAAEDTNIRGEFAAEDTAIRGEFATEDTAIRGEFATEDTAIRGEFATEDTNIRGEFAAEDTNIRGEFATEDLAIRGEFASADSILQTAINTETSNRVAAINLEATTRFNADTAETAAREAEDNILHNKIGVSIGTLSNAFFSSYSTTLEDDFKGYASNMVQDVIYTQGGISNIIERGPSGEIRIGENSLVTVESVDGSVTNQDLYAEDALGNAINIDVTNGSDLLVNGESVLVDSDYASLLTDIGSSNDVVRGEFAAADDVVRGEFAAADDVVRGEFAAADNVVRLEFGAADDVVRNEFATADNIVRSEFQTGDNTVRLEFGAADDVVRNEFAAADDVVRSEFAAADDVVRGEFAAADDVVRGEFAAADDVVRGEFAAVDTAIRSEFAAADQLLQDQIDAIDYITHQQQTAANTANISANTEMIAENRKGIAMVAALTHSTVLPGKSHALDVSAAAFEGETGVAINYSGRLDENTQVNFGYAGTGFFEENIVRGGIGFQW